MLNKLVNSMLYGFSIMLKKLTTNTVNSACWYSFGQEEEPKSLQRFKNLK